MTAGEVVQIGFAIDGKADFQITLVILRRSKSQGAR